MKTARLPNGQTVTFPREVSAEQMDAAVRAILGVKEDRGEDEARRFRDAKDHSRELAEMLASAVADSLAKATEEMIAAHAESATKASAAVVSALKENAPKSTDFSAVVEAIKASRKAAEKTASDQVDALSKVGAAVVKALKESAPAAADFSEIVEAIDASRKTTETLTKAVGQLDQAMRTWSAQAARATDGVRDAILAPKRVVMDGDRVVGVEKWTR